MSLNSHPEVNAALKKFTITLFKIVFKKGVSITEKKEMLTMHIFDNKVWACYFIVFVFVLLLAIVIFLKDFQW